MIRPTPCCDNCKRYRRRIHALAALLDKEKSVRYAIERHEEWNAQCAKRALQSLYGKRWIYGHNYHDRLAIAMGVRTLINIGLTRNQPIYHGGKWHLKVRNFLWDRLYYRPLRRLFGIPR